MKKVRYCDTIIRVFRLKIVYTHHSIVNSIGPPQNVHVNVSETDLIVTWEDPLLGVTNDSVIGYNIVCSTSTMPDSNIEYKARVVVQNTTTSIVIPTLDNLQSNVAYNCCVEVEYETYSSIACASARYYCRKQCLVFLGFFFKALLLVP